MSRICAAVLLVAAAFSAGQLPWGGTYLDGPYLGVAVTALLLLLGVLAAIRSYSVHQVRRLDRCSTCRGAGTVYSAEWNDWQKKGPVQTIRELCPACAGLPAPSVR